MKNLVAGLFCLFMLFGLPVLCLSGALQAAPTPEHRAAVEAMPPDPLGDWLITGLAFGGCVLMLLVVLVMRGTRPILPDGGYKGPEVVRPMAPGPLAPWAENPNFGDWQGPLVPAPGTRRITWRRG